MYYLKTWINVFLAGAILFLLTTTANGNSITVENAKQGTTAWYISDTDNSTDGNGVNQNGEIKGFASQPSVNIGQTISFYVSAYDKS